MTVVENVAMVLMSERRELFSFTRRAVGRHRDEALALLEMVGMAAQADRPCGVLAYGDVKRVELAIALGNRPRVLLMDEPTAGMAPREPVALMGPAARLTHERRVAVLSTERSEEPTSDLQSLIANSYDLYLLDN